ncbi:MAG: hypothetical protein K5644_02880 [Lachnospiraceae bacterium]|nr:hypothetical protein [Lachnospiraceae bacterium]
MEDVRVITVSGFAFENPQMGEEALKEQEAIEYVNKQLDFDNIQSLLTLYNQMVTRRMFHTEVGYVYLKNIQDYLMKSNVDPANIESIPVNLDYEIDSNEEIASNKQNEKIESRSNQSSEYKDNIKFKNKEKKLIEKLNKYKKLTISFITISIVLVITVVAMFIVANTSNNPTILNYEEVIQDKYASWEQDLQRREAELSKTTKAQQ